MRGRSWLFMGALLGGMAVVAGAWHAHGLSKFLTGLHKPEVLAERGKTVGDYLRDFEVGVRYQMYHALALLAVGILASRDPSRLLTAAGSCFVLGVVLFCGLLYVLAFTGISMLGMIVPLGGLSFIVGWLMLAVSAFRSPAKSSSG